MLKVWKTEYPNREMPPTSALIVSASTFSKILGGKSALKNFLNIQEYGHIIDADQISGLVWDMPGFYLFENDGKKNVVWIKDQNERKDAVRGWEFEEDIKAAGLDIDSPNSRFLIFIKEGRHK